MESLSKELGTKRSSAQELRCVPVAVVLAQP